MGPSIAQRAKHETGSQSQVRQKYVKVGSHVHKKESVSYLG